MDKKKKILALVAVVLVGGLAALSATGGISGLRSSYIYDGDGNIIGGDSSDDTSTIGSTGDPAPTDTTTVPSEQPDELDNMSADELIGIMKNSQEVQDALEPIFNELDNHIKTYDQCATGIDVNLDSKLAAITSKTTEYNTALTNLQNYKNDAKNGTLVGKTRVSIAAQETERASILARMPAGSTVTATSTAAVNNARKTANTKLITDSKTGLNKQFADAKKLKNTTLQTSIQNQINAINAENKDIDRLNVINTQLANTYKVKSYVDLKKIYDTKNTELVALTGENNSLLNDLNNQKIKKGNIPTCQKDFVDWWTAFKKDRFSSSGEYIWSISFIPKAYAQTNQNGDKARRDADKARQKLQDKLNKAKEKWEKAARALNAIPEFAAGFCANTVDAAGEKLGKPFDRFSDFFERLCAGFPKQTTCNNGKIDEDEECDPSVNSSKDEEGDHYTCDSDCRWHKSI